VIFSVLICDLLLSTFHNLVTIVVSTLTGVLSTYQQ